MSNRPGVHISTEELQLGQLHTGFNYGVADGVSIPWKDRLEVNQLTRYPFSLG